MKEIKAEINTKGLLLLGFTVVILIFLVGYLSNSKSKEPVTFTGSDIEDINEAIEMYGDDILVTKDEDGNLIINLGER